jgi:hypothetical protein
LLLRLGGNGLALLLFGDRAANPDSQNNNDSDQHSHKKLHGLNKERSAFRHVPRLLIIAPGAPPRPAAARGIA